MNHSPAKRLLEHVDGLSRVDVVMRVSLALGLVVAATSRLPTVLKVILAVFWLIGFVKPAVLRSPVFWLIFTLGVTYSVLFPGSGYAPANHHWLLTYWLWVLVLATWQRQDERWHECLARNAKYLLVSVLAVSLFQKVTSDSYLDGSYIHYTFIEGSTAFRGLVEWIVSSDELSATMQRVSKVRQGWRTGGPSQPESYVLAGPSMLRTVSLSLTYFTIVVESVIVVVFHFNVRSHLKHWLLILLFVMIAIEVEEYTFASVMLLFGLTQCDDDFRKTKMTYMLSLFIVVGFSVTRLWR